MTVRELYAELDTRIPRSLSCEWDNDGLMCCSDGGREVKRVLVTLDVTAKAVEYAVKGGYDCIISHHPFIFKGLKAIDGDNAISAKAMRLISEGIAVMSFHTRLDAVEGGVNDILCALIGLEDVAPIYEDGVPIGRVGMLKRNVSADVLAMLVKERLRAPAVLLSDAGVEARRVAVVGGSGKDLVDIARAAGADTFVSGRLDYHPMTDGPDSVVAPMNMIEAGHFYTEFPVCSGLCKLICDIDPNVECDIFDSNVIRVI